MPSAITIPGGAAAGLSLITSQVLVGSQATFDTNSLLGGVIPTGYNHLKIVIQGRGDVAAASANLYLRLNNDSGANYDNQGLLASATTPTGFEQFATTQMHCGEVPGASVAAGIFAQSEISLLSYNGTIAQKTAVTSCSGKRGTTTGQLLVFYNAGWWRSAAAITRLTLFLSSGNFAAGTSIYFYGIT